MNETIQGIIWGVIFTLVIALVSISLTLFFIYYFKPDFVCELCQVECIISDFKNIGLSLT